MPRLRRWIGGGVRGKSAVGRTKGSPPPDTIFKFQRAAEAFTLFFPAYYGINCIFMHIDLVYSDVETESEKRQPSVHAPLPAFSVFLDILERAPSSLLFEK